MWIILEGIDRSGKSSVAETFKQDGFEVVHFEAPDKKYSKPGYSGPSYVDEILELLMGYDGQNVVFDRSHYGELIWPHVYQRKPQLTEADFEALEDYEKRNDTQKLLMVDTDVNAHWRRCVQNKEPLDRGQFVEAGNRYSKLAHSFGFIPKTLKDFDEKLARNKRETDNSLEKTNPDKDGQVQLSKPIDATLPKDKAEPIPQRASSAAPLQEKLEKANAINSILSKRIVKQKGDIFDSIEEDIKSYLAVRLSEIMGTDTTSANFSNDEVQMLKTLCKQWNNKLKG